MLLMQVSLLSGLCLQTYPSEPLLEPAVDKAMSLGRTVYDCFYLALAITQRCQLVTADKKFYNALTNSTFASNILWVEDI